MTAMRLAIAFLLLYICHARAASHHDHLHTHQPASKPPMGYNTWNAFATKIDEKLIRDTADLMVTLGLVQAGYNYLNIDDAWHAPERSAAGELVPDPDRFSQGINSLVEYAHGRGLNLGLYTDVGDKTCAGYPGSLGHEEVDAATFAKWGVEYIKVDNCYADQESVQQRYTAFGAALNATGKPMVYSLCSWGVGQPWRGWGRRVGGNTWRTSFDIEPMWDAILLCLDSILGLSRYAGHGGWNDPDMLEVGNGDLTLGMQRAHFALWSLVKAPLLIGTDLRRLALPEGRPSLNILLAEEVIAISQDDLGVAGDLIMAEGPFQVWAAPLTDGARAVVLLNRAPPVPGEVVPKMGVMWDVLGYEPKETATVRDLFGRVDLGVGVTRRFVARVPPGDCLALKITPDSYRATMNEWRPSHAVARDPRVMELVARNELTMDDREAWRRRQKVYRENRERRGRRVAGDRDVELKIVVGDDDDIRVGVE